MYQTLTFSFVVKSKKKIRERQVIKLAEELFQEVSPLGQVAITNYEVRRSTDEEKEEHQHQCSDD